MSRVSNVKASDRRTAKALLLITLFVSIDVHAARVKLEVARQQHLDSGHVSGLRGRSKGKRANSAEGQKLSSWFRANERAKFAFGKVQEKCGKPDDQMQKVKENMISSREELIEKVKGDKTSPYTLLGIKAEKAPETTFSQVSQAYLKKTDGKHVEPEERKKLTKARDTLQDPELRASYDLFKKSISKEEMKKVKKVEKHIIKMISSKAEARAQKEMESEREKAKTAVSEKNGDGAAQTAGQTGAGTEGQTEVAQMRFAAVATSVEEEGGIAVLATIAGIIGAASSLYSLFDSIKSTVDAMKLPEMRPVKNTVIFAEQHMRMATNQLRTYQSNDKWRKAPRHSVLERTAQEIYDNIWELYALVWKMKTLAEEGNPKNRDRLSAAEKDWDETNWKSFCSLGIKHIVAACSISGNDKNRRKAALAEVDGIRDMVNIIHTQVVYLGHTFTHAMM